MLQRLKQWARRIKIDVRALFLAARDSRTPWLAKLVAVAIVAYAMSPIDLIPDFIPVLGLLDDIVIVPLGMLLAIRLIPAEVMQEARAKASELDRLPASRTAAAVIIALWIAALLAAAWWAYTLLG